MLNKKYLAALLLSLSAGSALALPPAVEMDRLMLHAQMALDAGSHAEAADKLVQAQKLGIALPESFALRYATALNGQGKTSEAKAVLEKYLNKYGTRGASYKSVMTLLVQIESQESGRSAAPAQPAAAAGTGAARAGAGPAATRQRVPARPRLPFEVSEDIWQTIEASEAYRNAPAPRPYKVSYRVSDQMLYTGSKNSFLPRAAPTGKSLAMEATSLGEKCWVQRNTTSISGAGNFTSDNYVCGGFLSLGSTDGAKATTFIKGIDELTGSLFPMRVGNQMSVRYQLAFPQDRRFDSRIAHTCQVTGKEPAGELDPALKGAAWRIHCQQSYTNDYDNTPRVTETDDYYLEDLGVRLSAIGQLDFPRKKFILPRPGTQTVLVTEGPYASQTTSTYAVYDWSVGDAQAGN